MGQDEIRYQHGKRSRFLSGVVLLAAGVLLLGYKMGAPIPPWVFTWPVLLIVLGLLSGVKSRFHNPGAFIMIIIGSVFLIDQSRPNLNFHNYIVPAILIGLGLVFILRPKRNIDITRNKWNDTYSTAESFQNFSKSQEIPGQGDNSEFVEISAVFGGIKKIILSKNFKGGELNSFMGGTELNLMQADIQHPVVLEVHNVFGGTKLLVPSNWDIKNQLTAIFGGIEDKRNLNAGIPDTGKTIILKGACIFGGIEISNY